RHRHPVTHHPRAERPGRRSKQPVNRQGVIVLRPRARPSRQPIPMSIQPQRLFDRDFGGTFAPCFRALDSPMAMACFRLFTFLPERPLFSLPRLNSCIALLTCFLEPRPYLAMTLSFQWAWFASSTQELIAPFEKRNVRTKCLNHLKK